VPSFQGTPGPGGVHLPLLKIDIVLAKKTRQLTAMVDSGADRTVVPRAIIEALGVNWDSLKVAQTDGVGASGVFEIRICRGKIRWRGKTICEEFWTTDMDKRGIVLLGREDFFTKYDVDFRWSVQPPYMDINPKSAALST
jgi:hypothetical protein